MRSLAKLFLLSLLGLLAAPSAQASAYVQPKVGTVYHFYSSLSGEGVSEVVSSGADRYGIRTTLASGARSRGVRLYGIWFLSEMSQEGIGAFDVSRAAKLFPLKVGNKVGFDTYGSTDGGNWTRRHAWEVVSERLVDLGSGPERLHVISLRVEAPDFFKFEGTCDYSARLAVCLRLSGDQFIRRAPHLTGRLEAVQNKVVIDGVEVVIPKLTDIPSSSAGQGPRQP